MEWRLVRLLLHTSAFPSPKHHGASIQSLLLHDIYLKQTVQQCFKHPFGNLVFPRLDSSFCCSDFPFYVFWPWTDTMGPNHSKLSSACHLLPGPVMNLYTKGSKAGQGYCSNFPITFSPFPICYNSQLCWQPVSAGMVFVTTLPTEMTTLCKTLRPFAKWFPLGQINNWTARQREISKHGLLRRGGLSQEPQVTRASKSLSRQWLHLTGMNSSEVCLALWNMEILDKTQDISHDDTTSDKKETETQTKNADLNSPELQRYPALGRSAYCDWSPQVRGSENHSFFLRFQNVDVVYQSYCLILAAIILQLP